jgi:hypothetical protein
MRCLSDLGRDLVPMVRRWKHTGNSWEQIFLSLCEIHAGIFPKFLHSSSNNHDYTIALYLSNAVKFGCDTPDQTAYDHILGLHVGSVVLGPALDCLQSNERLFSFLSKFAINVRKHFSLMRFCSTTLEFVIKKVDRPGKGLISMNQFR